MALLALKTKATQKKDKKTKGHDHKKNSDENRRTLIIITR